MNSEVTKYLVAGSLAFSSDITVLYLCTDHLGLHYLVSNILGYSTGVLVAYLLNVNWVFSERIYSNRQLEFLLFNLIVFSGLLISELTMSLMVELAGIGYLAAKVFSSGFVMVSNYVGKKVFLFHAPELATTSLQKNNVRCSNCGLNTASYHSTAQAFDAGGDAASSTFDLTKCTNCALLSTSMDSGQDITRFYPKSYYGDGTDKFVSVIERFLRLAASIRARRITQVWDHSTKDTSGAPRVIDIGCGRALLLRAMQKSGSEVLGLERKEFPLDRSCKDIVELKTLTELANEDRKFDVGVLWHVLEHMDSPDSILDEMSQILSPQCLLVIAVPNYSSLQRRLFGPYWFHLDLPRHLVHIESDWLLGRLEKNGFTVVKQSHFDLLQNTYGFIQSAMNICFPTRPNAYYAALKHDKGFGPARIRALLGWSILASSLLPFALIELVASSIFNCGATIQLYAARNSDHD
jgi:putative flippase GtrA/SAM-dependent methyltransferase